MVFDLAMPSEVHDQLLSKLRLVSFRAPYSNLTGKFQQLSFGALVGFKVRSYRSAFPDGILPFGAADLVSDHLLIVSNGQESGYGQGGGMGELICGVKMLRASSAAKFRIDFPSFELKQGDTLSHREAINTLCEETQQAGKDVVYAGSWTIAPEARLNASLSMLCYRLTAFMVQQYTWEQGVPYLIAFANRRLKVERFHQWMGFSPMTAQGKELPVFKSEEFFGDPMSLSVWDTTRVNFNMLGLRNQYKDLWESRLQVDAAEVSDDLLKAA